MSKPSEKEPRASDKGKTLDDLPDPKVKPPRYRIITESEDLNADIQTFVDEPKVGKKQ